MELKPNVCQWRGCHKRLGVHRTRSKGKQRTMGCSKHWRKLKKRAEEKKCPAGD